MSAVSRFLPRLFVITKSNTRGIATSSSLNRDGTDSWLSKLLVRKIEPTKEAHSRMLSDKEVIYALHTHNVRTDSVEKYLNNYKTSVQLIEAKKDLSCDLVASWTVQVGDMDQCLHLWRYTGGFEAIDQAKDNLWHDDEYLRLMKERGDYLRSRHLQYLLAFSYWPHPQPREDGKKHIYEMRSYRLTPGTMIEWANNWARAINYRKKNAYAGFFSQIGRLYNVHHIWCYDSLQARKETREAAWRQPGWDECVAYTVPLIRDMHCRILSPTEFSPTQ